jgi:GTP-binding protein
LHAVRRELQQRFGDTVGVQVFSGESKQGVDEARAVVAGWLGLEA